MCSHNHDEPRCIYYDKKTAECTINAGCGSDKGLCTLVYTDGNCESEKEAK